MLELYAPALVLVDLQRKQLKVERITSIRAFYGD